MKGSHVTRRAAKLAARQEGNVSHGQLVAAGLSPEQIARRVQQGWLVPRHTCVFAIGHVPRSRASRWSAALLALGDDAVLGFRSAAAQWDAWGRFAPTEVIVPPGSGRPHRDGIVVHRCALAPGDITTHHGLRVTTPLRTVLDVAAVARQWELERAFEELQVRHGLSPVDLAVAVLSRSRRRGNARLRRVLDGAVDPAAVRSVLELRFLKLCAAHDIPRPVVNEPIGIWTPDFRWEAQRVIVETDGVRFHMTAAKRARDARKDDALRALGYTVIRLRWADVVERPEETAARILAALSGATSDVSMSR
jgi:hypothetical protein